MIIPAIFVEKPRGKKKKKKGGGGSNISVHNRHLEKVGSANPSGHFSDSLKQIIRFRALPESR